ncbi:hypothetical protein [Phenylobacterium sp.]|uniref:hypothetical protein n=1 Tax=Phenylobacterium sp. TaxID=1871053 RepID=UPI0035ADDA71
MPIPPPIDPRQLAAEIGAAVSEFNRLANLAAELGLLVQAEIIPQPTPGGPGPRPVLAVQVVAPL